MTRVTGYCDSHPYAKAVATIPHTHKISATETQTVHVNACRDCRDVYASEQAKIDAEAVIRYTPEWHTARIDRFASEIRQVVADWFERDESDEQNTRRLRGKMLLLSRNLSAEMGDLDMAIHHPTYTGIRINGCTCGAISHIDHYRDCPMYRQS